MERELTQVQRRSGASDHELRVAKEEALQELARVQNLALAQKLASDNEVIMAKEEAADDAKRLRAAAEAETTADVYISYRGRLENG